MQTYEEELLELTNQRIKLAEKYAIERKTYGQIKASLDVIFAANIKQITAAKKNCGYETGLIILMGEKPELMADYGTMVQSMHNFKAIQRMLDSLESKAMTLQSIMKYNIKHDGGM